MWSVCILKAHGGSRGKPCGAHRAWLSPYWRVRIQRQSICFLGRKGSGTSLHREAAFYEDVASGGQTLLLMTAPLRGGHLTKDSSVLKRKQTRGQHLVWWSPHLLDCWRHVWCQGMCLTPSRTKRGRSTTESLPICVLDRWPSGGSNPLGSFLPWAPRGLGPLRYCSICLRIWIGRGAVIWSCCKLQESEHEPQT